MPRVLTLILLALPTVATAAEGWIGLLNATQKPVRFQLANGEQAGAATTIEAGEVRALPAGHTPTIRFDGANGESRYRLQPFGVYAFIPDGEAVGFQAVELAGKLPDPADVPALPVARPRQTVTVLLACDIAETRTRAAWEARARAVIAEANAILEQQINLTLLVSGVTDWRPDARLTDLDAARKDLMQHVRPGKARLVIGFTPQALGFDTAKEKSPQFAAVGPTLSDHLVVRDALPRPQAGRTEVLVQAIGRWLGAGGAPDTQTVMRPKLGDGLAGLVKFRVQFDPFNALIVNIVAAELREGHRSLDKLSPQSKARLVILYQSILAAKPADPATVDAIAALEPNAAAPVVVAEAQPEPARPKPVEADPRRTAIRHVVSAIRLRAQVVRDLPPGDRPRGDDLTNDLVRVASEVAATTAGPHAAAAVAVGIGIGLDDSTTLRDNIITRDLVRAVESDAEFKERTAALGRPTVRGRRDLCQHFALSSALTEILGAKGAELAGVTKELRDLGGESGFSFVDLLADFSGVAFAEKLLSDPNELGRVRIGFKTDEHVPAIAGLRENLTAKRFEADYGGLSDPRFKLAVTEVRDRVAKHLAGK